MAQLWGGIEAGGTRFVCAIGSGPDDIVAETRFATIGPEETIRKAVAFFQSHHERHPIESVGIASFGPVDLNTDSPTGGHITSTPKAGWRDTDIAGMVGTKLGVPVGFDTDVNGAALAEGLWGAAQGLDTFVYLTVGTGIGGGGLMDDRPMRGLVHPEMGHVRIPHDRSKDPFDGVCPYHGDCLEGLASGPAMQARWNTPSESLSENHPAWELEATYLALGLSNLVCTLSPQRIVVGGGVMEQPRLLPMVRAKTQELLGGYVQAPAILEHIDEYVVPPGLGRGAGVLGAIALAKVTSKE